MLIGKTNCFKLIIGGHFGAGKTTFIKTVGGENTLLLEKRTTAKGELKKDLTTVGFDFTTVELEDVKLHLFGLPGQYRFNFLWETLFTGADVGIFLIDRSDKSKWPELFRQILLFKQKNPQVPIIIATNKNKFSNVISMKEVKEFLKTLGTFPIYQVEANDYDSIITFLQEIKENFLVKNKEVMENTTLPPLKQGVSQNGNNLSHTTQREPFSEGVTVHL